METGEIIIGDARRALVRRSGLFLLEENPAAIEMVHRVVHYGLSGLGLLIGVGLLFMTVPIVVTVAALMLLGVSSITILRTALRPKVGTTHKILATIDPNAGSVRWEANGAVMPIAAVAIEVRLFEAEND